MTATKITAALAATSALLLGTAACTAATPPQAAPAESLGHVHAFAHLDSAPVVFVGTHTGLWKFALSALTADASTTATLIPVGDDRFDVMGLTSTPAETLIASGHPASDASPETPANRGFLESTDSGITWKDRSLSGAADFHDLLVTQDTVIGLNSADETVLLSSDTGTTWTARGATTAQSLALDPNTPRTVWAAGPQGLELSTDQGITFSPDPNGPPLSYVTSTTQSLTGATASGEVWSRTPTSGEWEHVGQLQGAPQALDTIMVAGKPVNLAVDERAIVASHDGGTTWKKVPLTLTE